MFKRLLSISIFLLLLLSSYLPIVSCNEKIQTISIYNNNHGTLSGYVKDTLMNPIKGVRVRVNFHDTYEENYTDTSGYYHITNIPLCYCIKNATAYKEGYKNVLILLSINETTIYNFILLPLGEKLYVGGFGPNNYTKIQDAINDASPGDTVFVYNGTYYENIVIEKKISLTGSSNRPIINGNRKSFCILINKSADGCIIEEFNITNASTGIIAKSDNNNIHKNFLFENNFGIYLHYSNSSTIKNNKIFKNKEVGLKINFSKNNYVTENHILNNKIVGIWIFFSYYNTIYNNIISNNSRGFELGGYKNKIWGNLISNNSEYGIHYWATCANIIYKNNFFNNREDAEFSHIFIIGNSKLIDYFWICNTHLLLNYWNGSRLLPNLINGNIRFFYNYENIETFRVPWFEFDWLPAKNQYDIQIPKLL